MIYWPPANANTYRQTTLKMFDVINYYLKGA